MKPAKTTAVTETPTHDVEAAAPGMLAEPVTWIAVSFLLFIVVAIRYVVPAITQSLDNRSSKIREQLELASRLRADAEALLAKYRNEQEALLKEAEILVARARDDAASMRAKAEEELKLSLDRRSKQAEEKIARAEAEAISQIRKRMIDLATDSARTSLAGDLAAHANESAIERALSAVREKLA